MNEAQRIFVEAELFQLTLGAVTQRGRVYQPKLTEKVRREVHKTLRETLQSLLPHYTSEVLDTPHLANIELLAKTVTDRHSDVLFHGTFRIGSAQKALNLHLKYRWCLEEIHKPPHCPFDFYVLRKIPGWKTRRWTTIDSIAEYARLVAAARAVANGPLADWELSVYNDAVNLMP